MAISSINGEPIVTSDLSVTYTKLSKEGSIIEALKDRRVTYDIDFEQGRIDTSNGSEVGSSTQIRSQKGSFHSGAVLIFKTDGVGANVFIHKYSTDGTYNGYVQLTPLNSTSNYRAQYVVDSDVIRIAMANDMYSAVTPSFADNVSIYQEYSDYTDVVRTELQDEMEILGSMYSIDAEWHNFGIDINTGAENSSTSQCRTKYVAIGDETRLFDVTFKTSNDNLFWFVSYYDVNKAFISSSPISACSDTIETPEGARYLRMVLSHGSGTTAEDGNRVSISFLPKTKWYGKKYSVLGDSLSTYNGYSPSDGQAAAFYPRGNLDQVEETWWYRVGRMLGMTLDTCNAYSSSIVTGPSVYTSMSSDDRLSSLGSPDIVFFCGGTNDIYINANIGDWRGYDVGYLEDYVNEFTAAYTRCVSYIQAEYNCKIMAITPSFVLSEGYSGRESMTVENLEKFCNAINTVCSYMGVEVVDSRKLGMSIHNVSNYTVDGLHWDVRFTSILANQIYGVLTR